MLIRKTDSNGVTLVELMIAVAIFAVLILGLGQTVLVGQRASKEAKRQANILLGCQQVLEQVQQKTVAQLIADDGSTFQIRAAGPEGLLEDGADMPMWAVIEGKTTQSKPVLKKVSQGETLVVKTKTSLKIG